MSEQTATTTDSVVEVVCGACRGRNRLLDKLYRIERRPEGWTLLRLRTTGLSIHRMSASQLNYGRVTVSREDQVSQARRIIAAIQNLPTGDPRIEQLRDALDQLAESLQHAPEWCRERKPWNLSVDKHRSEVVTLSCSNSRCENQQRYKLGKLYEAAQRAAAEGLAEMAFPDDVMAFS